MRSLAGRGRPSGSGVRIGAAAPRRVRAVLDRLESLYGRPRLTRRRSPLDELVLTILSQNTSDTNRDRAYASLRGRFGTWGDVLRAGAPAVEQAIRSGGLARIKSRVIVDLLRRVRVEEGRLDLDRLKRLPLREAREALLRFKGVGEKTACCVLLFSCNRPAFPVDTHIERVTKRLGWIPEKATARQAHALLAPRIPAGRTLAAHVNLITLGRRLCRPRNPACPGCPLRRLCPHAAKRNLARGLR